MFRHSLMPLMSKLHSKSVNLILTFFSFIMKNLRSFGDFIIPKKRRLVECAKTNQLLDKNKNSLPKENLGRYAFKKKWSSCTPHVKRERVNSCLIKKATPPFFTPGLLSELSLQPSALHYYVTGYTNQYFLLIHKKKLYIKRTVEVALVEHT